jgi:hypothetical protein
MGITKGRVASLLVGLGYMVWAIVDSGATGGMTCLVALALPLALIWFPDEAGSLTGYVRGGYINKESPPIIVSFMGWFFLVGMPVILYLIWR